MFAIKPYHRLHAVAYAEKWALARNPLFQNFSAFGGDCTNFASQCLFAGSCVMNETAAFGWYWRAAGDYAQAWTGVPFFHQFLTGNMESGPYAEECTEAELLPGDFVQLGTQENAYHTMVVTGKRNGILLVCAHDRDVQNRPLSEYAFEQIRYLHVTGVRFFLPEEDCCFSGMLEGRSVFPASLHDACCPACERRTGCGAFSQHPVIRPADLLPDEMSLPDPHRTEGMDVPADF